MIILLRNEKGIMLISVYLLIAVMAAIMTAFFWTAFTEARATESILSETHAFYLAEAGVDRMIYNLNQDTEDPVSGTTEYGGFSASYSGGQIISTGTTNSGQARTLYANVERQCTFRSRGAFCAGYGFGTGLFSRFEFDGREHDSNGDLTGGEGEFGVSVRDDQGFYPGLLTRIGGHGHAPHGFWDYSEGIDYETDAEWAEPITHESVLGLEDGALDEYESASPPPPNFDGIYYVHNPYWDVVDFGTDPGSTGILIVENDTGWSSFLGAYTGNFEGILISDTFISFTNDLEIVGTSYALGPFLGLLGSDSYYLYSEQVINDILLDYLGGKVIRYTVTSWSDENVGE